jgi:hypothetical protein
MARLIIEDYTPAVKQEIEQKASIFLRLMADEIVKISEPLTPMSGKNNKVKRSIKGQRGSLRRNVVKRVNGLKGRITWEMNYAAAQEAGTTRGYPIKNYTTPGTGSKFAERGVEKAGGKIPTIARRAGLI